MKVNFLSIRAKNFLQIGNDFESFPLNKSPFTVIVGPNGSGKSTLLDMITYVLYKKSYRRGLTLSQLINSVNKKQMVVEIAFNIGNSTYVVRRGDKPKLFEIYRDRKLIEPDPSIGDMQDYLENTILGQNFKTFCQINVIGKATYKQFLTLDAKDRRSVIEDIFDSAIYSVMLSYAKDDLKNLTNQKADCERDISIIENKIQTTKVFLDNYQAERDKQRDRYKLDLQAAKDRINENRDRLSALQKKHDDLKIEIEKIIPSQHMEKFEQMINQNRSDIGGFNSIIARNNSIIDKIDSLEKCPHCLQVVDENHKNEIVLANNAEKEETLIKLNKSKQILEKFEGIKKKYAEAKNELSKYSSQIQSMESGILLDSQRINEYNSRLLELDSPLIVDSNLPDLDSLQLNLEQEISKRDNLVANISKTKQAISHLGDDGIKAKLINKYIPVINNTVNKYLEQMGMYVEFELDSEFNEKINAINRETFTYNSFSEGQRMRVDLAILLTWRKIAQLRNSMTTNLFLLDEIADGSLDEEGMNEFMAILRSVSEGQNTFIISHKESTIQLVDDVIRVETVGNFSRYTHG